MRETPAGVQFAHLLADYVRALDPSGRAVTSAVPGVNDNDDNYFAALDVAGYGPKQSNDFIIEIQMYCPRPLQVQLQSQSLCLRPCALPQPNHRGNRELSAAVGRLLEGRLGSFATTTTTTKKKKGGMN
jgi:hypothetical protein